MADDQDKDSRTEDPTEKRLSDALEEGNVPFSREVTYVVSTFTIAIVALVYGQSFTFSVAGTLRSVFANNRDWSLEHGENVADLGTFLAQTVGIALLPILLPLLVFGLLSAFVQNQPRMVAKRIQPKWEKVSLQKGLKRLFGSHAVKEFGKSLFKFVAAGCISMFIAYYNYEWVLSHILMDSIYIAGTIHTIFVEAALGLVLFLLVLGAVDYILTHKEWFENLKMSQQDIKDERKQSEGDPMVKMRNRSIAKDRARKNMISNAAEATMVIANPTHFSIALRYDPQVDLAPFVLAKGQDIIALKIRAVAEENDIPIIEDKPLARSLYKACTVEKEIPFEFYVPIARIVRTISEKEQRSYS